MRGTIKNNKAQKTFPDENFISRLRRTPRVWILFANDQWIRAFESHDSGLRLIREFRYDDMAAVREPFFLMDRISLWLDEAVWEDDFSHLILAAPLPLLTIFKKALSLPVLARLTSAVSWPGTASSTHAASFRRDAFIQSVIEINHTRQD